MSAGGGRIERYSAHSVRILARGSWPAERLRASWTASSHRLPPAAQEQVDDAWVDALARPGVHLYNGALCRLEGYAVGASGLHLRLSRTTYKDYLGTNVRHPEWAEQAGGQLMANPVGTSVALSSGDGFLIFGMRSDRVALYPCHAHPFGGTMEVPEPGSSVDLIAEMARELAEEVGIACDELDDLRAIAVTEDRTVRQPELVYAGQTRLLRADIEARLDLHEHTACWSLAECRSDIEGALLGSTPLTPVLRATLLAWGADRYGPAWLHRMHPGDPGETAATGL
jgi:hypothetical protein